MSKLLSKLHFLLIALFLWFAWGDYTEYLENEESKMNDDQTFNIQLTRVSRKVNEIKVYKKNLERSRKKLQEVRSQIDSLRDKLPSEKNDTKLLNFLSDQADRIRLLDSSFKPLPELSNGLYFSERYEVVAAGNYQQFLVFLEKLNDQSRIYNVDVMELRTASEAVGNSRRSSGRINRLKKFELLESRIVLETYRFNKQVYEKSLRTNDDI